MEVARAAALAVVLIVAAAAAASGATAALSQTVEIPATAFNECTGDFVNYAGKLHITETDNHFSYHITDGKAVGVPSGARYVVTETFSETTPSNTQGAESTTITSSQHLVRVGEDGALVDADDFYLHMTTHVTTNAAGVPTAEVENSDIDCR